MATPTHGRTGERHVARHRHPVHPLRSASPRSPACRGSSLFGLFAVARPTSCRARACASSTSTSARCGWPTSPSSSPRSPRSAYLWKRTTSLTWDRIAGASRRDRRAVHGAHAVRRRDVGPAQLGQLLGVGRPGHHHGVPVHHLRRLPRRPRPRRQPPAAGPARRRRRPARRARDPARALQRQAVALVHQDASVADRRATSR